MCTPVSKTRESCPIILSETLQISLNSTSTPLTSITSNEKFRQWTSNGTFQYIYKYFGTFTNFWFEQVFIIVTSAFLFNYFFIWTPFNIFEQFPRFVTACFNSDDIECKVLETVLGQVASWIQWQCPKTQLSIL